MTHRYTANLLGALAVAVTDRARTAMAGALDASPNAAAAVLSIGTRPAESIDRLAAVLGLSHSATVRIVDQLEKQGLVRRLRATGDHRTVALELTREGKKIFGRLIAAREAALLRVTGALTPSETNRLTRLLSKMLATLPADRRAARHICRFCDHGTCHDRACPVGRAVGP